MLGGALRQGLAGASLLLLIAGCSKPEAKTELTSAKDLAPVKVQTTPAAETLTPEYLTLTGTLKASQESDVAADATGKVTATMVERGQAVKQGDTLAVLDARSAALTANQATAQSGFVKTQAELQMKECERVQALFRSGAISQAELDRQMAVCQAGRYTIEQTLAAQKSAQKVVGDSIIRAPFSGIVGERSVNVGQYVLPSTKVVSLYAPDPLRLELTVPEANVSAIKQDLPVSFTVATFGDKTFTGAVKFISPNVRASTRDLVVEALVPNADFELKPGMFAVARLTIGERKLPAVPVDSVKKDETGVRVFVVVDKKVQERVVQLGGEKDGIVGIVSGVKANENVVVKPGPDVRDGAPVP